jgi:hypothetical protein
VSGDPEPARDASELLEILDDLKGEGYAGELSAREGGSVRCGACGREFAAGEAEPAALRRTEGASDPGDMAAVAALICPLCGTKGALVLRFGPEAGIADTDVLTALQSR